MLPLTSLDQALPVPQGGIASRPLLDQTGGTKVVLFAMDAHQEISSHCAAFPAEMVVLEGMVQVWVGDKMMPVASHGHADLPAGVPHGLRALVKSHVLLTMRRGAEGEEGHHGCSGHGACHGSGADENVRNPLLLRWMEEHAEGCRRLGLLGESLRLERWDAAKEVAHWLDSELRSHNEAEEHLLFPLLDPHFPGGGPTFVMRAEHQHVWGLMERLNRALAARNGEEAKEVGWALIEFLRSHIEKENRILYPMAERLLTHGELDALASVVVSE